MTDGRGGPSSSRWRRVVTVDPEIVALAFTILIALAILLVLRSGSPTGAQNRSPDQSTEPGSSGSISFIETPVVGGSIGWLVGAVFLPVSR